MEKFQPSHRLLCICALPHEVLLAAEEPQLWALGDRSTAWVSSCTAHPPQGHGASRVR